MTKNNIDQINHVYYVGFEFGTAGDEGLKAQTKPLSCGRPETAFDKLSTVLKLMHLDFKMLSSKNLSRY